MPRTYQMASTSASSSAGARAMSGRWHVLLAGIEPLASRRWPRTTPVLLAAARARPAAPSRGRARRGGARSLGVLLGAAEQVVAGHEPLGRRGEAAIALEAGPDERLVGQVVPREQAGDPLEERRLRERPGRRQEAEHGPLHAVRERHRRGLAIGPVGQPPATRLDLDQPPLARSAELVADEGEQPLDVAGGDVLARAAGEPTGRASPRPAVRRDVAAGSGGLGGRRRRASAAAAARCRRPRAFVPPAAGVRCRAAAGRRRRRRTVTPRRARIVGGCRRSRWRPPTPPPTRRRRWPARSRPTRISPSRRSVRAGSPRALRTSTAASVTVRDASGTEKGRPSKRSGGANRPRPGSEVRDRPRHPARAAARRSRASAARAAGRHRVARARRAAASSPGSASRVDTSR